MQTNVSFKSYPCVACTTQIVSNRAALSEHISSCHKTGKIPCPHCQVFYNGQLPSSFKNSCPRQTPRGEVLRWRLLEKFLFSEWHEAACRSSSFHRTTLPLSTPMWKIFQNQISNKSQISNKNPKDLQSIIKTRISTSLPQSYQYIRILICHNKNPISIANKQR